MSQSAFERYAPFIQEYIYRKKWTDLREVQVEACNAILDTECHVIIASGTASGKTEAAFFPVLTTIYQKPCNSIGVMYISPLKALINDQFKRLNDLLEESYIPVWPWHGDISQSVKKRAAKEAQGILQITPESLEAMLMKHPGEAARLFSDLRFIIIDEIHALMGTDRGLQILCLLSRLEKIIGLSPRRIGLSATLNDYQSAMDFLSAGSNRKTIAVGIQFYKRTISLCVESFIIPSDIEKAEICRHHYNEFLYEHCHDKKCLIFTNSRSESEKVIADMKALAQEKKKPDVFFVHHGSVSSYLRQEAENALKNKSGPTVTAATLTLELGIDIGDLDSTIQIGAPYSCSSFIQRLGCSGRKTGKSQMLFIETHKESSSHPLHSLPWDLLRIIAIIQLYLEERWVEPFFIKPKPFSLLAHQTLSTLITYGGLLPSELAKHILLLPTFKKTVSIDEYRELLKDMIANDYLQRMESGEIIVGLKGEHITNHYSFYSLFEDEETYTVQNKDIKIGTLDNCPVINEVFALAGHSWKVNAIDQNRKIIYVNPIKNNRIPNWNGSCGQIHDKIVKRMYQVLKEKTIYTYLRPNAIQILQQSRQLFNENTSLQYNIIPYTQNSFFLCPWVGTKIIQTIKCLFSCGLKDYLQICSMTEDKFYLQITSNFTVKEFIERIHKIEIDIENPNLVLRENIAPKTDKFDIMVPKKLLRKAYLYNEMDLFGAVETLKNLKTQE